MSHLHFADDIATNLTQLEEMLIDQSYRKELVSMNLNNQDIITDKQLLIEGEITDKVH